MKLGSFALIAVLAFAACDSPVEPTPGLESIEGVVVSVEDQTPLDGPVRITLALHGGGYQLVVTPGLFLRTDDYERRLEIVRQARELRFGERVLVRVRREESWFVVRDITRLR